MEEGAGEPTCPQALKEDTLENYPIAQYIRRRLAGSLLARCHVYCYMLSDSLYSLVVVPICRDTYMLLPSKMEGGDRLARTLPVCLVWGIGGVALGCDESGRFEPYIGEDNVKPGVKLEDG
jgi:hypothetical protein